MLKTYLAVKTVFLLLNLALLLLYLILCGIALIQAVVERREFQKTIKQLVDDEKNGTLTKAPDFSYYQARCSFAPCFFMPF